MEITKHDFIEAITDFFRKEYNQNKGDYNFELVIKHKVLKSLVEYFNLMDEKNLLDKKVHIGHVFGPFGFKVKE